MSETDDIRNLLESLRSSYDDDHENLIAESSATDKKLLKLMDKHADVIADAIIEHVEGGMPAKLALSNTLGSVKQTLSMKVTQKVKERLPNEDETLDIQEALEAEYQTIVDMLDNLHETDALGEMSLRGRLTEIAAQLGK